ncbi:MAG: glutathione synthase [Gammaproteobacteria bacterium]|nr:glutathione synthase [Gammaproteobacteria bacterium]
MAHIAFVMDPIATLNINKDSTLGMIRAAQRRGWRVSVLGVGDLALQHGQVVGWTRDLALEADALDDLDRITDGHYYRLGPEARTVLAEVDLVMMRKDPPFDMEYVYATYLLERARDAGALVVNDPTSLRDCNEKFYATGFTDVTPPLIVATRGDLLLDFHAEHGDVVFKKLDGMGGKSIFRVRCDDPNLRVIIETLTADGDSPVMAQKFIPEIEAGDKRILLIDGEPVPYALARIPKAGESRGNLAAGGEGVGQPLSERDAFIAAHVGPELRRRGLRFVGIDVIGDYLTEINVTCPTCIRELDRQFGLDIAGDLLDALANGTAGGA